MTNIDFAHVCLYTGWGRPFNLQNGWILWAGGGLVIGCFAVFLVKALISASSAGQTPNQVLSDSLLHDIYLYSSIWNWKQKKEAQMQLLDVHI